MLVVLAANIEVMKKGQKRVVPAQEFYRDDGIRHTALAPSEMVTGIQIPDPHGSAYTTFIKLSMRRGIDFAMASIAASVTANGNGVHDVRLVLGALASQPKSLARASQVILESGLTDKAIEKASEVARTELGVLTNLFTSAGYKRQLAEVLVKRALNELKAKTGKSGRAK
jgi:CO/xanthine dehydrogenase FAD-binding subunit